MINLLSVDQKRNLRAARLNVVLRRYVNGLILALLFLIAAFGVGYWVSLQYRSAALADKKANEQEIAKYAAVKKQAEAFEANLKSAKTIFEKEVMFSEFMVNVAKVLPSGAVLTSLNVTTEQISSGEPIVLNARTVDAGPTPLRLKGALEASDMFEDVSLSTITREQSDEEATPFIQRYPVSVTLSVTIDPAAVEESER